MPMQPNKPESQLVRLVMPDATDAQIEEATRRWFGFLQTIDSIVTEREQAERDSRESHGDDSFEVIPPTV